MLTITKRSLWLLPGFAVALIGAAQTTSPNQKVTKPADQVISTALPLPKKTDIPPDFSTTICPSAPISVAMLKYLSVKPAPLNHDIDVANYFKGLAATNCTQDREGRQKIITIQRVLARTSITLANGPKRWIAYQGLDGIGRQVFGIVDEDGNNAMPRTPLERWAADRADDKGWLDTSTAPGELVRAYICPSLEDAKAVVAAVGEKGSDKIRASRFKSAISARKCVVAKKKYKPTGLFGNAFIGCGNECGQDWTAIAAKDVAGKPVALVYDASLM